VRSRPGSRRRKKRGKTPDPAVETPAGVPASYGEHIQILFDILTLAFQTDTTRVATFLLAHDGSNRSFVEELGISEGHHDLSHHQNRQDWIQKITEIDRWYITQFAKFLEKLEATKDTDGSSLLHNSMIRLWRRQRRRQPATRTSICPFSSRVRAAAS
jgi:hypothetical protein